MMLTWKRTGNRTFIRPRGFTLVELLVVIGIIALLISILLPALSKARKLANTVACAANMHSISLGMMLYAQQYHGAILGNANTSSAFLIAGTGLITVDSSNIPEVTQIWDWTSPTAKVMGVKFDEGGSAADRSTRFSQMSLYPPFQCPENNIIEGPYSGEGSQDPQITTRLCAYSTSYYFQTSYDPTMVGKSNSIAQGFLNTGSYFPNITRVRNPSTKVYMFESAKWTNASGTAPDYDLAWDGGGSPGGQYSDAGPWDQQYTRSFKQGTPLVMSMRHGDRTIPPTTKIINSSKYRLNVIYFDGHCETIDGHKAMNPTLYVPSGTVVTASEMGTGTEAYNSYMSPASSYIAP